MKTLDVLSGLALVLPACTVPSASPASLRSGSFAAITTALAPSPLPISIVNGSFEADTWATGKCFDLGATGGPVTGWTVIDPVGDPLYPWGLHDNINQHDGGPTPFGDQWFVLGGPFGAGGMSIEQTVGGLTPGSTYALGFALSTEEFTGGSSLVRVSFPGGSSTASTDITVPPSVAGHWRTWTSYSIDFVADLPAVTFRFTDLGSPTGRDAGLDNVTVTGRGVDLSIEAVRVAQVVFDPDVDSDGRIDLVARKSALAIVTIRATGVNPGDPTPVVVELRLGTQVATRSLTLGSIPAIGTDVELFFRTSATGDADLSVEVDPADAIVEWDEGNNVQAIPTDTRARDSFRVGFVEVRDSLLGDDYGPPREFAETVARADEFIAGTFPVADSAQVGVVLPGDFRGAALPEIGVSDDVLQIGIGGKLADPSADRVLGIVPDDYFAYHRMPDVAGITYLESFGGLVREGYWTSAAHALGHMLGIAQEEYALPVCNDAEGYWVARQTRIDDRVCFLCSPVAHDLQTHWVDEAHYGHLFGRLEVSIAAPEALLVSGFLLADGSFEPSAWYLLPGATISRSLPGNHAVRILNAARQVVAEAAFPVAFEMHVEPLGTRPVDRVPLLVTLPYPDDAGTVQILRDGQPIGSFSPSIQTLHAAVDAVPEDGFSSDPHARRQALHRQIDVLRQLLEAGRTREAQSFLVNRIRPRILLWIREEYVVFRPTQFTRPQVLAVVDAARVRIGNL